VDDENGGKGVRGKRCGCAATAMQSGFDIRHEQLHEDERQRLHAAEEKQKASDEMRKQERHDLRVGSTKSSIQSTGRTDHGRHNSGDTGGMTAKKPRIRGSEPLPAAT